MWISCVSHFDSTVGSAGSALLCAILVQFFFTEQSELWSELMSWTLLPIIFKITEQLGVNSQLRWTHDSSTIQSRHSRSLWVIAASLSIFSFYKAENGFTLLYPILVPLLQAASTYLRSSTSFNTFLSWPSTKFAWFSILSGVLAISTLSHNDVVHSTLSTIAVSVQFLVYVSLLPCNNRRIRFLPHVHDFEKTIVALSKRTVPALVVAISLQTVLFGFTAEEIAHTLLVASLKALSWYFIARTARNTSWTIAPLIQTVALLSTLNPFHQSSLIHASFFVIASLLALAQVIHALSKQSKFRHYLWFFHLVSLIPYLANIWAIQSATFDAEFTYSDLLNHPVETMINRGFIEFDDMVRRQSKSYIAAEKEYRRRYNASPTVGFEAWYNFTVFHKSPIIDEFDAMYHSIAPFWRLSGKQVTQIMEKAYVEPESELWLCKFESKSGQTSCRHAWRKFDRHIELLFNRLLGELKGAIPDVKFLVNHLDEPRVLIPPSSHEARVEIFNLTNSPHQPNWNELTKSCIYPSHDETSPNNNRTDTFDLPFVNSHKSALNLCQHPEYRTKHGFFQSPTSFRLFSGFVPVLSTGAPSTMGDILFPSPAYVEEEFQYDEKKDFHWDDKTKEVYWAGSTTGGFADNDEWRNFHRQQFVAFVQGLGPNKYAYLRKREGLLRRVESSFLDGRLFHVAFTRIFQCEKKYCRDQKAFFRTRPWANKSRALKSRLTFDLDGNGISGRYYQLLASRSTPLKQTLLREWHDDRLYPWVHYIPISQSMEELPELVSYFMFSKTGQQRAKEIAEQGREWFSKAFRDVDMTIYIYRMLLELARLQDPKRQAIT